MSVEQLESVLPKQESTIAKDLRLNLKKFLFESALNAKESLLALLALATSAEYPQLIQFARENLPEAGASPEEIQEASESAAIVGMLNTYYKFRYMINQGSEQSTQDYSTAGLRMMSLARPVLGKASFEMLAFAVSVLNGCQSCIIAHEKVLRDHGIEPAKIHDLARIASVVRGMKTLATI